MRAPSKMVFFLPNQSPHGPAKPAPMNAPPVNTLTTAPCSAALGLKTARKFSDCTAPAITPRSYPNREEPRDAKADTRN